MQISSIATSPTALELCQKARNEIREERDAALAEIARLRKLIDIEALPVLTIAEVNALPEGRNRCWPMGLNDAFVAILKAALLEQRRRHARAVDGIFLGRTTISEAVQS